MATSRRGSETPRWCWTKRSLRQTPAIRRWSRAARWPYWQNGKVYLHTGTQSTAQTVPAIARWLNMDPEKVVFISEYTGGGFGSKITGGVTMIIPALLSKKPTPR
jgi:CO/xanthine dehydrogenase Mo-binding subunit